MAFIEQEDILNTFEGLIKHLFLSVLKTEFEGPFPRMTYEEAMNRYGNDKPDIRFGMRIRDLSQIAKGKDFKVFDTAEYIGGINANGCAEYSRKQLDELTDFVTKPQVGAKGLVWIKWNTDGTLKSTIDKFYSEEDLKKWAEKFNAKPGDLLLILAGKKSSTLKALSELRLEIGNRLNLRDNASYAPLWVLDFPLLEWDEESKRLYAMHHPFTSPKPEDFSKLDTTPGEVRANAYDMVINGVEVGGGSIRIHDQKLQQKMFKTLGFTDEEAEAQFGFLMNAFRFGAPPHGGIAFGFDRLTSLFAGLDSIRDVIAFPKNNSGRDIMIDSPALLAKSALEELGLEIKQKGNK
jgi:aspartyl-tRNA synthetase